jgi:hypothetical protein
MRGWVWEQAFHADGGGHRDGGGGGGEVVLQVSQGGRDTEHCSTSAACTASVARQEHPLQAEAHDTGSGSSRRDAGGNKEHTATQCTQRLLVIATLAD